MVGAMLSEDQVLSQALPNCLGHLAEYGQGHVPVVLVLGLLAVLQKALPDRLGYLVDLDHFRVVVQHPYREIAGRPLQMFCRNRVRVERRRKLGYGNVVQKLLGKALVGGRVVPGPGAATEPLEQRPSSLGSLR